MSRNEGFLSINAPFGGVEPEDVADVEGVFRGIDGKEGGTCAPVRVIDRCCRRGGGGERLVYESDSKVELEGANDKSGGPPRARLKFGAELALDKSEALRGSFEPEPGGDSSPENC